MAIKLTIFPYSNKQDLFMFIEPENWVDENVNPLKR